MVSLSATAGQSFIADPWSRVAIADLAGHTSLGNGLEQLRGRCVMILTRRQLTAALAAVELDGVARRVVLCTPDLPAAHLRSVTVDAEVEAFVVDPGCRREDLPGDTVISVCSDRLTPTVGVVDRTAATEWVLLTSGTTGRPKLALHTLDSLIAPLGDGLCRAGSVWSTFYDVRRYGGLQMLLRALVGGATMVLSDAGEAMDQFLTRAGADGVTHISGTPSHWRSVLMSAAAGRISPDYLRLSGEACDQALLDRLRHAFPAASIAHAFASTEAGVAFDVRDGRAGFPASMVGTDLAGVEMRIEHGSLRIRSARAASRYLGAREADFPVDPEGFVDTGDMVELRGERYHFIGRRGGVINVGGLKVHPESVEAVINEHPAVHSSRVSARSSPITGAIVVAEIVMKEQGRPDADSFAMVRSEIIALCRSRLPRHQIPTSLSVTRSIGVAVSGKMARLHA